MGAKTFEKAYLDYLENYNTIATIEERIDDVIANILRKELDLKAKNIIDSIQKPETSKLPKKYKIELDDSEEWKTTIALKDKKSEVLEFCYGFDNDLQLILEDISNKAVYFCMYISLGIKGNGFKNLVELRTFWNQQYKSKLKDNDYILPNNMKNEKDHPYAYYGIFSILGNGILPFDKKRGKTTYSAVVEEAINDEFKTRLKHYLGLTGEIEKWRKDRIAEE
jgi:hypothetical protein